MFMTDGAVATTSANCADTKHEKENGVRIAEPSITLKATTDKAELVNLDAASPVDQPPTEHDAAQPVASSSPTPSTQIVRDGSEPPLSKKALKRRLKAERFQATKLERRAREKAARKEKKRARRERLENGEQNSEDEEAEERERKRRRVRAQGEVEKFNARVVVDLAFDHMMSEKEINSLSSQLAYTYAANRRAGRPFAFVLFSSLNGKLRARMDADNDGSYRRWTDCEWWEGGFEHLWSDEAAQTQMDNDDVSIHAPDVGVLNRELGRERAHCERGSVVYLTADSDNVLEELKEGETYVLGGIVDHNRYKNLCRDKASKLGVRTAQLPIGKFMAHLPTRKVLTVNQTFEILVNWLETRNWEEALSVVIPKRKLVGPDGEVRTATDERDGERDDVEHTPQHFETATIGLRLDPAEAELESRDGPRNNEAEDVSLVSDSKKIK